MSGGDLGGMPTAATDDVPRSGAIPRQRNAPTRWGRWTAVIIGLGLAMRIFLLSEAWFWQDDFVVGSRALLSPLNAEWLFQVYSGHLMPAYLLQWWVSMHIAPMSWTLSAVLVVAWSAAFGAAFWYLVIAVVGRGPAALVATAVATITPLWAVSVSWFASAMQSIPSLTFTTLAAAFAARLVMTGQQRWAWLSIAAFIAGLAWFEKAALGLVLIVFAVAALALSGRAPHLRSRAALACGAALLLITAAYAVAFILLASIPGASANSIPEVLRLVYEVALSIVPTGLVGGPWQRNADGSTLQVLITQPWLMWIWSAFVVVLLIAWRRSRLMTVLVCAITAVMLIALIALVARARLDFLGPVIGRDTRYVVDMVPVAALGLALLIAGGPTPDAPRLGRAWRRFAELAAPAVALVYALVAWPTVYAVAESRQSLGVDQWVTTATSALVRIPGRVFVDSLVPDRVVSSSFGNDARLSRVLGPFGVSSARFNQPALAWWRIDDAGTAEPALFVPTREVFLSRDECGVAVRGDGYRVEIPPAPTQDLSGLPTARIGWYSRDTLTPVIEWGKTRAEVDLTGGVGYIFLPLQPSDREIAIGGLGSDESFCISSVEVGVSG